MPTFRPWTSFGALTTHGELTIHDEPRFTLSVDAHSFEFGYLTIVVAVVVLSYLTVVVAVVVLSYLDS